MAHFVDTDIGLINLDLIISIRLRDVPRDVDKYDILETVSGQTIRCRVSHKEADLLGGMIVPAAPGTQAIVVYHSGEWGRERPETLWRDVEPIIGWRDANGYLYPIYMQELAGNAVALLPVGDRYRELAYDGSSYESLEVAEKHILETAQRDWDRRHPPDKADAG